jgi:hypothetical protein
MSREEVKKEIDLSLNYLSDKALNEVLGLLKKLENIENENLDKELELIFKEDKELLQRLAQ